ncbi:recQ-mediated genome instability protein 1 [Corythoichthys intestinalis]|uniref:recQ-mediated genome instability protein 1 n=1 Tax=Corythoichthys intestinalis TaxID=161448 RepID=UPI0025A5CBA6|nr:recQ-mediated genome instability protein 1 [Corythoichthys intestinalis]XP_057687656.1 recQ-mediated genome instability protein 1 [Corythoichthys intestinalis]XP_057687657.1 recQ-mediated genome instability protein 1 [Corythoichthys intestinalis]XP_057687658.1 recQ-mediated genome instability protein 1 [Corythoichthys intestinalis]XP_061803943.1 recQ-mediated genome instability protein 1-like [Nerophis lumbriciformis]
MASQAIVQVTQDWLQSSLHVRVPFAWLEACVEWLQEEAGGAGRLSQQNINQQVFDQWLSTDLKDLAYAVLPEGIAQTHSTQLNGTFCVQVDSLRDISQPAYSQLQQLKGTDCANDSVSATTQSTQRPWESRPTRMLLLQVTDGVQSLEAMEYQPIPALSTALRPGVKLRLHGQMICRLGMLLLGPGNVNVLGGEVEELAERNNQGRILCQALGLPEEQLEEQVREEVPPSDQDDVANHREQDFELDDLELLATLEAQEEQEVVEVPPRPVQDSGYRTLTQSSGNSNGRSLSTSSTRSETSIHTVVSGLNSYPSGHRGNEEEQSDVIEISQQGPDVDNDFPDEDFFNVALEVEDVADFQGGTTIQNSFSSAPLRESSTEQNGFDVEDMDFSSAGIESYGERTHSAESNQLIRKEMAGKENAFHGESHALSTSRAKVDPLCDINLTSPPFTYLCLLDKIYTPTCITIKAFIVTLLGKLSTSDGLWQICATLSDGSGYLDAKLSDRVLTDLLGFTVAVKGEMRRDPARRSQLDASMRRCQEELVDMCCLMTVEVGIMNAGAVVTQAKPVSEGVHSELERRVRDRK